MLSVIVVSFNTRDLLRDCLASLQRFEPGAEVIVVDNGSVDGSPDMVRQEFPEATLLNLSENLGFAGANNVGIAEVRGEFLVLLNSDTVLEDDSLSRCVEYLKHHPDLGALSPRLIGPDTRPQRHWYPLPSLRSRLRTFLRMSPPSETPAEGWLPGTALVLRRKALESVGGRLDDGYFIYWEDADLSASLLRAGWRIATYNEAQVRHLGGASGGGADASRRTDLHAWYLHGQFRWFSKHRPAWERVGLWFLEALEVPRAWARSMVRPHRRQDAVHARVLAQTLIRFPMGWTPPRPRPASEPARPDPGSVEPKEESQEALASSLRSDPSS